MKIHVIGSAKEGKSTIATLIARTLNSYGLTVRIEDLDVQAPDELQQKRLQAITSKGLNVTVKVVNSIADSLEEDRKLDDLFRAIEYTSPVG